MAEKGDVNYLINSE
jgi:hypothetical protein